MNDFFQENKRPLLLMIIALFVFAIVLYFLLVRPMVTDLQQTKEQTASKQAELDALKNRQTELEKGHVDIDTETLMMEKKVPTERQLSDYLINLQKIETSTKTVMEDLTFTYDSTLNLDEENVEAEETDESTNNEQDNTVNEETENQFGDDEQDQLEADTSSDTTAASEALLQAMPEDLHAFTVTVTAESPSFDAFFAFIEAVEEQERLSIMTRLVFDQPTKNDELSEEQNANPSFEVDLTTFYYPH